VCATKFLKKSAIKVLLRSSKKKDFLWRARENWQNFSKVSNTVLLRSKKNILKSHSVCVNFLFQKSAIKSFYVVEISSKVNCVCAKKIFEKSAIKVLRSSKNLKSRCVCAENISEKVSHIVLLLGKSESLTFENFEKSQLFNHVVEH